MPSRKKQNKTYDVVLEGAKKKKKWDEYSWNIFHLYSKRTDLGLKQQQKSTSHPQELNFSV